jgi:hypothetical protein
MTYYTYCTVQTYMSSLYCLPLSNETSIAVQCTVCRRTIYILSILYLSTEIHTSPYCVLSQGPGPYMELEGSIYTALRPSPPHLREAERLDNRPRQYFFTRLCPPPST